MAEVAELRERVERIVEDLGGLEGLTEQRQCRGRSRVVPNATPMLCPAIR